MMSIYRGDENTMLSSVGSNTRFGEADGDAEQTSGNIVFCTLRYWQKR